MLSVSQIGILNSCGREWIFRYKEGRKPAETPKYFIIGTAFHRICEGIDTPESVDLQGLDETEYPYRAALKVMAKSYDEALKPFGYMVYPELRFESEKIRGIVDGICIRPDNSWSLLERKTTSRIEAEKPLTEDLQLSTYVLHTSQIAYDALLNHNDFKSVLYIQTLKPTQRKRKSETLEEFGERLTSETLVTEVPKERIRTEIVLKQFEMAEKKRDEVTALYEKTGDALDVPGETKNCIRFGKPCSFYELCHGANNAATLEAEATQAKAETRIKDGSPDLAASQPIAAQM